MDYQLRRILKGKEDTLTITGDFNTLVGSSGDV